MILQGSKKKIFLDQPMANSDELFSFWNFEEIFIPTFY